MKRALLVSIACIGLGGCAGSVVGDAMRGPQVIAQEDSAYCESIGARYGTPEYTNCRLQRSDMRTRRHSAALSSVGGDLQVAAPPAAPPPRQPVNCTHRAVGGQVLTNCY